jgi:hypothetical protein
MFGVAHDGAESSSTMMRPRHGDWSVESRGKRQQEAVRHRRVLIRLCVAHDISALIDYAHMRVDRAAQTAIDKVGDLEVTAA